MRSWNSNPIDTPPNNGLEELFAQAAALPARERAAWLDAACVGQPHLRAEVEDLLRSHETSGFLDADVQSPIEAELARLKPEEAGERIGNYRLLEQIGEGGFGTVWVADQERPVRRRVALKIIKLGMDTKEVIARFEQERQALAMMDHPNIAKVHDAGATQYGRPYFVMELVRGTKITSYCDQVNLPTSDRLELFIAVCHAVQHAHQKGIIHRDLKPSNILVTLHDGVPVPKVIDFGVAKATQSQRLSDLTVYTQFEQMIGTPLYMSPEQAEMSGLDIDTRSDIYSLGVLLYELLVGRTPFDPAHLMQQGIDEIRRTIREQDPPKPSTAVQTMPVDLRMSVAQHRQVDPTAIAKLLRRDLDWIVMKALEKDRSRRYETANGLAADIRRHLQDKPVSAGPPSKVYQFQKFVRRNKVAFASSLAVVTALATGIVVSTLQVVRARQAESVQSQLRADAEFEQKRSEAEAKRATAVSNFLQELLSSADPSSSKGSAYTVRQMLDDCSARLKDQFTNDPETEATLRNIIGDAYRSLGLPGNAKVQHERALELRRKTFGEESTQVAESLTRYCYVLLEESNTEAAEKRARQAVAILEKRGVVDERILNAYNALIQTMIGRQRTAEIEAITEKFMKVAAQSGLVESSKAATLTHMFADLRGQQGRFSEAEIFARKALEMHSRFREVDSPQIGWTQFFLGMALKGQQKWADAEAAFRAASEIFAKSFPPQHRSVVWSNNELNRAIAAAKKQEKEVKEVESGKGSQEASDLEGKIREFPQNLEYWKKLVDHHQNFGRQLLGIARTKDAERSFREAQKVCEQAARNFPRELFFREGEASARRETANALSLLGRFEDAEKCYREAIGIYSKLAVDFPQKFNFFMKVDHATRDLSRALEKANRFSGHDYSQAIATLEESNLTWRRLPGREIDLAASLFGLSYLYRQAGILPKAENTGREALAIRRNLFGDESEPVTEALHQLGWNLYMAKKHAEAETLSREELKIRRKAAGKDDLNLATCLSDLTFFLRDQGKLAEAEDSIRECYVIRRKKLGKDHSDVNYAFRMLSDILRRQGKPAEKLQ